MSNMRIILVLFVLSEALVAFYGAQAVWRSRSERDGRRPVLGILIALGLTVYGIAQTFAWFNALKFGRALSQCLPSDLEYRTLVASGMRVAGIWIFSLSFANANSTGPIKRLVNRLLERFRG